jgi:hypothetical protein
MFPIVRPVGRRGDVPGARFKTDFRRMRLLRTGVEVVPIVPGRFCGPAPTGADPCPCRSSPDRELRPPVPRLAGPAADGGAAGRGPRGGHILLTAPRNWNRCPGDTAPSTSMPLLVAGALLTSTNPGATNDWI